jgi:outer membrane protein
VGATLLLTFSIGLPVAGQDTLPTNLTLDEAIEAARRNNPGFQATRNDLDVADWQVRSAYGAWLPRASASGSLQWQEGRNQSFGLFTTQQILGVDKPPDYYLSGYSLGLSYTLSGATLMEPGRAKKAREATTALVRDSEAQLAQGVTRSYLEVLRQEEGLLLAMQELERAEINSRLARGRLEVGSATALDVNQAEVAVGRAQVAVLLSENAVHNAQLRLLQLIGVELDQEVSLATRFQVEDPRWTEGELLQLALDRNPNLASLRGLLASSEQEVKIARSAYFPSLSLSAGISGFTREASESGFLINQAEASADAQIAQCNALNELFRRLADPLPPSDCSQFGLTDSDRRQIIDGNDVFPFDFTRQPATASLTVSIPIFQGLSRQFQLEGAKADRNDLRYRVREAELALRAELAAGLANLRTAHQTALIEERNQVVADEQLRLAQEQYRLGLVSFLELVEAETVKAQADRERVQAVFAYHDAVAELEYLVGSSLRNR